MIYTNWQPPSATCVHVCTLRKISRLFFLTGIVCPNIGQTRTVEKVEFQCQGAVQGAFKGPCKGLCTQGACKCACTLRKFLRFLILTGIVFNDIGKTRSFEKVEFQCQGAVQGPMHANAHAP